jgi:DNA phosphorothioation-associated putative methyltransferase
MRQAPSWKHSEDRRSSYPDFETVAHPALLRSVKLSLRTRELDGFDYAKSSNPPVLHRKESFLPPDHSLRAKFARLTRREENHGLLDDTASIGTRDGWNRRLEERGFSIKGHRLVKLRPKSGDTSLEDRAIEQDDSEQSSSSS